MMIMIDIEKTVDRIIFRSEELSKHMTFIRVFLCVTTMLLVFLIGMAVASRLNSGLVTLVFYLIWSFAAFLIGKVSMARLNKI